MGGVGLTVVRSSGLSRRSWDVDVLREGVSLIMLPLSAGSRSAGVSEGVTFLCGLGLTLLAAGYAI